MKRWPEVPKDPTGNVCTGWGIESWGWPKAITSCKHGLGECEVCGTTDRRDVRHATRGGAGAVGQLIKRRK